MYNTDNEPISRITAASRYESLETKRQPYLKRARDCAALTIPSLFPPEGSNGATTLHQPYQSVGADCVNNLSAKVLMALFPPGEPCFRYQLDDFLVEELASQMESPEEAENARAELEEALGKVERAVTNRLNQKAARQVQHEAIEHLVVAGNGLVHTQDDSSLRFFRLDKYVVCRDNSGNTIEVIVKECLSRTALPQEVLNVIKQKLTEDEYEAKKDEDVELYTWVSRQEGGSWKVHQEVEGEIIESTRGTYPEGKCPWIPLRWRAVSGEDYGRGRCEEYLGDLMSLEAAAKSIVEFGAIVSKVVFMVNEGGVTQAKELAEAESGDVINGDAKDVTTLQVEKVQDFQIVKVIYDDTKQRLERGFLLPSSVQRDAERVTAEEIRLLIGQLEQGMGGVYTIQSTEFQLPLVTVVLHQMMAAGELPKLPEDTVTPHIVTGLDGLGRNADLQKLDMFLNGVPQILQEAVAAAINVADYLKRRAASLGIDAKGLIKSPEQMAQEQQQAAMQQMVNTAIPNGINAIKDMSMQQNQMNMQEATSGAA